jgi:hypothetical protein
LSVHDPPRLHFEPFKLQNFYFNADPDPDFYCNADPDPASKNNADSIRIRIPGATVPVLASFLDVLEGLLT